MRILLLISLILLPEIGRSDKAPNDTLIISHTMEMDRGINCTDAVRYLIFEVTVPAIRLGMEHSFAVSCSNPTDTSPAILRPMIAFGAKSGITRAEFDKAVQFLKDAEIFGAKFEFRWAKHVIMTFDLMGTNRLGNDVEVLKSHHKTKRVFGSLAETKEYIEKHVTIYVESQEPQSFIKLYANLFGEETAADVYENVLRKTNYFAVNHSGFLVLEDHSIIDASSGLSLTRNRNCAGSDSGYCDADLPDALTGAVPLSAPKLDYDKMIFADTLPELKQILNQL